MLVAVAQTSWFETALAAGWTDLLCMVSRPTTTSLVNWPVKFGHELG